jgi:hypothetical protein
MPYVVAAASVVCTILGIFDDNPALSSPTIKIYTYVYLVLMLVFQEITYKRLMQEYREATLHYEKTSKFVVEHVGNFQVRLQTVIFATP